MANFAPRHFCQDEIEALPTPDLRAIVRSTKPDGFFMLEFAWAKSELIRRYARKGINRSYAPEGIGA